jgi:hypothetical protein
MKTGTRSVIPLLARVALLGLLVPAVLAHGDDPDMDMDMGASNGTDTPPSEGEYPPTYFALDEHTAAIYGHIALMVIGWVFVLPVGKISSLMVEPTRHYRE